MDREILLYVPVLPDLREYWQIPARELAALVGGTTAIPSIGLWIDDKGQLVQDQIVLLQSLYQQEDQPTVAQSVERLAQQIALDLDQTCVLWIDRAVDGFAVLTPARELEPHSIALDQALALA